jgi:hypothetical protein
MISSKMFFKLKKNNNFILLKNCFRLKKFSYNLDVLVKKKFNWKLCNSLAESIKDKNLINEIILTEPKFTAFGNYSLIILNF